MPTTQLPADEPFTDPIINLTYAIVDDKLGDKLVDIAHEQIGHAVAIPIHDGGAGCVAGQDATVNHAFIDENASGFIP